MKTLNLNGMYILDQEELLVVIPILWVFPVSVNINKQLINIKWMSFSEEGILTRFRLFTEYGNEVFMQANNYPFPIVDYGIDNTGVNKIWSSIPYGASALGFTSPEFLEGLRNGAFLLNKETVGFGEAKYVVDEYLKTIYSGENTFSALRETIQNDAMTEMSKAKAAVEELLGS